MFSGAYSRVVLIVKDEWVPVDYAKSIPAPGFSIKAALMAAFWHLGAKHAKTLWNCCTAADKKITKREFHDAQFFPYELTKGR